MVFNDEDWIGQRNLDRLVRIRRWRRVNRSKGWVCLLMQILDNCFSAGQLFQPAPEPAMPPAL